MIEPEADAVPGTARPGSHMISMPLRILMLHNRYLQPGGEDESTAHEVELLRSRGHHVELAIVDNTRVAEIGKMRTAIRATWSREAHTNVARKLSEKPFDLVHVQNFFPLLSPAVHWAAHGAGVPVVQTLRNYRLECANAFFFRDGAPCTDCLERPVPWPAVVHRCYRGSRLGSAAVATSQMAHRAIGTWRRCVDAFITLSEFSRNLLVKGGLERARVFVKPNFLSPDPGVGTGGHRFLFVGRLSPEKGLLTLLEAWDRLSDHGIELDIIGDGPLRDLLVSGSRQAHVRWHGSLPHHEVIDLMGNARAVVVPSEWYETFGRVGMEALARGTPVVVSRHGALEELVEHEVTGLHFQPGDSEDLARQLRRLHHAHEDWMRTSARKAYLTRFGEEKNYDQLISIYQWAMGDAAQRGSRATDNPPRY